MYYNLGTSLAVQCLRFHISTAWDTGVILAWGTKISYIAQPKKSPKVLQPKCKANTVKLIQENREVNLHDLGSGNGFLNKIPQAQTTEEDDTLDLIKITNLCFKRQYQKSNDNLLNAEHIF